MALFPSDLLLVHRNGVDHQVRYSDFEDKTNDTDLLVLNRNGKDFQVTVKEFKDSLADGWDQDSGSIFHIQSLTADLKLNKVCSVWDLDGSNKRETDLIPGGTDNAVIQVDDAVGLFKGNTSASWDFGPATDTSKIVSFNALLQGCSAFNGEVVNLNFDSATDTSFMFDGCKKFNKKFDHKIGQSFTGEAMFRDCESHEVALKVAGTLVNASKMFMNCKKSVNPVVGSTGSIVDASYMYSGCAAKTSPGNFTVRACVNMEGMFENCALMNGYIGDWDVSKVENFSKMFKGCSSYQNDLSYWNTKSATNMSQMFYEADRYDETLNKWCVSSVTDHTDFAYSRLPVPNTHFSKNPDKQPQWGTCPRGEDS